MARTNIIVFGMPLYRYTILSMMLFFCKVIFGNFFTGALVGLDKRLRACCASNQDGSGWKLSGPFSFYPAFEFGK